MHHPDGEHSSSWDTPLHLACESGNKELVQWVYERAEDPKHWLVEGHMHGDYPWERAVLFDHLEIALTLLKYQVEHIDSSRLCQSLPLVCDQDVKFIRQAMELMQTRVHPILTELSEDQKVELLPYTVLYTALETDCPEAFSLIGKALLPADADDETPVLPDAALMTEALLGHCPSMIRFIWENPHLSADFQTLPTAGFPWGYILSPDVVVFLLCYVQPEMVEQRFVSSVLFFVLSRNSPIPCRTK